MKRRPTAKKRKVASADRSQPVICAHDRGSRSLVALPVAHITGMIVLVRGQKVLLDRDLAGLYGVEPRALNQAVKRHPQRFPNDFMFSLSRKEIHRLAELMGEPGMKRVRAAYAFSEHGVAMLSSVLNSPRAVQVNIAIMRTFARLRQMLAANTELAARLNELEKKYDSHFKVVFEAIRRLMEKPSDDKGGRQIGFHTLHEGEDAAPAPRNVRSPVRY